MADEAPDTLEARWARVRDQPGFRRAEKLLRSELVGTKDDVGVTHSRVVRACLNAQRYAASGTEDPQAATRRYMKTMQSKRVALAQAARTLALSCEAGDVPMKWALALIRNGGVVRFGGAEGEDLLSTGRGFFRELERTLEGPLPELDGGQFLSRFVVGNLLYAEPLPKKGRPVEVTTMLAFELVYYLRRHTAGDPVLHAYQGAAMPRGGKPLFHVAAAFCNAALGTTYDGKQLAARVRKIPAGTCLIKWPRTD